MSQQHSKEERERRDITIIKNTHPIAVENGDLFSSADSFGFVVALVEALAVPPTTTF